MGRKVQPVSFRGLAFWQVGSMLVPIILTLPIKDPAL